MGDVVEDKGAGGTAGNGRPRLLLSPVWYLLNSTVDSAQIILIDTGGRSLPTVSLGETKSVR